MRLSLIALAVMVFVTACGGLDPVPDAAGDAASATTSDRATVTADLALLPHDLSASDLALPLPDIAEERDLRQAVDLAAPPADLAPPVDLRWCVPNGVRNCHPDPFWGNPCCSTACTLAGDGGYTCCNPAGKPCRISQECCSALCAQGVCT